jgi:hypothetical protein
VRNREDLQSIRQLDVDNVVGEAAHEDAPDVFVVNPRGQRPDSRILFDPGNRGINSGEKLQAEFGPVPLVPACSFRHFGVRFPADPKR